MGVMRGHRFDEESGAGPFRRWGRGPRGGFGPGWFGPGFGGPGFGGPGFGGPPPFGRGPKARRGDVRAAALALLSEGPRNGYQIIQEVAERSGGMWRPSPGSVYPALQQLQDEGLVRAEGEGRRWTFHLTDEGRAYVQAHADELDAPWEAFADAFPQGLHDLREVGGGVAMAAMQVAQAGGEAQVAEAVRILTETRRALYRILAEADPAEGEADV
jgi:DNA-binding PadR family transcriptional regulator